jgi:hypothetical protein
MLGVEGQRRVQVEVRNAPGLTHFVLLQIDDSDQLFVAHVHVEQVLPAVDRHGFEVGGFHPNAVEFPALIGGDDADIGIGLLRASAAICDVEEPLLGIIESGIRSSETTPPTLADTSSSGSAVPVTSTLVAAEASCR